MNNPSDSLDARLDARRRRRQITRKGVKEVPGVPEPHQANYCKTSPLDLPLAPFMALSRTSCAWISLTSKLHACMLYSYCKYAAADRTIDENFEFQRELAKPCGGSESDDRTTRKQSGLWLCARERAEFQAG